MKIAIAEDNYFLAKTIQQKLAPFEDVVIEFVSSNGEDLLNELKSKHNLDAIIMDIEMPIMDGIAATTSVKKRYPQIKILMFTVFEDQERIYQAIQAGANGYLLKEESGLTIYAALQELKDGRSTMSPKVTQQTIELLRLGRKVEELGQKKEAITLSKKELEVLEQISKGLSYKIIADNLAISPSTVRKHTENIYKKLEVHNKTEAINKGFELNLISR